MNLNLIFDEYQKIIKNMTIEEWNEITAEAEKHTADDWETEEEESIKYEGYGETNYEGVGRVSLEYYVANSYACQSIVNQNYGFYPTMSMEGEAA